MERMKGEKKSKDEERGGKGKARTEGEEKKRQG